MGDQIKQALTKLKEFWNSKSPKFKKVAIVAAAGVLVFAAGTTLLLNLSKNSYQVLFPTMDEVESQEVYSLLKDMEIDAQLNNKGQVLVRAEEADYAIAEMAIQHYPKKDPGYDIFNGASGLTTTEFEKRQGLIHDKQNRLQEIIRRFNGVENAAVTLNLVQETNRVWESNKGKSTGSVVLTLKSGVTLSKEQVSGIKYLVSSSVGIELADVQVVDAATSKNLKSTEDGEDLGSNLDFELQIEENLVAKAMNVLTLSIPPEEVRVSATVVVDYKKMLSERKEYTPSGDSKNNSGVLESEDYSFSKEGTGLAEGIPGEDPNTDVGTPTYLNEDGTLNEDVLNYDGGKNYLVSYITEQINNDKAQLESATMAVALKNPIDEVTKQAIRSNVSKATNIPEDSISIENFSVTLPDKEEETKQVDGGALTWRSLILPAAGALLLLIICLVVMLILRKRKRKKKEALLLAEEEAARAARDDMQKEFEDRKRQLKETAESNNQKNAITNEVRDFAKTNPEITANLLRSWLKEEAE